MITIQLDDVNEDWLRSLHTWAAAQPLEKAGDTSDAAFILIRARNEDGKWRYLLQKRGDDGSWSLPGGRLHDGEGTWDAALREATEEMGKLPPLKRLGSHEADGAVTFFCEAPAVFTPDLKGASTPEESAGWGWFSRKELPDLPLHPAFEEMLDEVNLKGIGKAAAVAIEKKYNPLELRDRHGRWVKYDFDPSYDLDLVGSGAPNIYDDEDQGVYHERHGVGDIHTITRGKDGKHYAVVNFEDGATEAFRYREPNRKELREGWLLGFHHHEPESLPVKTFDKTATAAMKRLRDAFPEGMLKTQPSLSPRPFDLVEEKEQMPFLNLLPPIATAIRDYVSTDSTINKGLRSGNLSAEDQEDIRVLDEELAKESLTRAATVYRGFTASDDALAKMTPGSEFTDHAYISTASDPVWAQRFAVLRAFGEVPRTPLPLVTKHGGKPVIMKISVPAGGHMIKGESDISEFVLPRDTTFKVTEISPDGSLISVRVMPSKQESEAFWDQLAASGKTPEWDAAHGIYNPPAGKAEKKITATQAERLAGTEDELDFGLEKAAGASLLKAGPKGYIHGWIYVGSGSGSPYMHLGDEVSHPELGRGSVSDISHDESGKTLAALHFRSGEERQVEYRDARSGQHSGLYARDVSATRLPSSGEDASAAMDRLNAAIRDLPSERPAGTGIEKTPDTDGAIYDYVSPSSGINRDLRSRGLSQISDRYEADHIAALDRALAASQLSKPATLYRGVAASPEMAGKLRQGAVFTDSAFTSATYKPEWAARFAVYRSHGTVPGGFIGTAHPEGGKPVVMRISIPEGGHVLEGDSSISEYILPRDTRFKVTYVSPDGSLISARVLGGSE